MKQPNFYLIMSLVILAVVAFGFGQTVSPKLVHAVIRRPALVWVHATIFSAWVILFAVQSALIRVQNLRLHRTLGWFGAALGALVAIFGLWTALVMRQFDLAHGPPLSWSAPNFTIASLDIATFTIPFLLAILLRKRTQAHRRLMLVATIGLCSAAFVRFPAPIPAWPWYYLGTDALVLTCILRDFFVERRVHLVYALALPTMAIAQYLVMSVDLHYWP